MQRRFIDVLASVGYSGKSPYASGTAGTVAALVLYAVLVSCCGALNWSVMTVVFAVAVTLVSVWVATQALKLNLYQARKEGDPGEIVIDELAGFLWTVIGVPFTGMGMFLAFFFFRLFDVVKPFPARNLERLPQGWGVVLDDVAAGVYANIATVIVMKIFAL